VDIIGGSAIAQESLQPRNGIRKIWIVHDKIPKLASSVRKLPLER